jgi:lysophospholipase L1-like esterase
MRAPRDQFRVAAFGDSLMWGQGLRRADRFAWLITNDLAAAVKRNAVLVADASRSGAQINAGDKERALISPKRTRAWSGPGLSDGVPRRRGRDRGV